MSRCDHGGSGELALVGVGLEQALDQQGRTALQPIIKVKGVGTSP
jgi:hypothetical protein